MNEKKNTFCCSLPSRLSHTGHLLALLAHVLPGTKSLHLGIARVAEGTTCNTTDSDMMMTIAGQLVNSSRTLVLDKPQVGQLLAAHLAGEALWVPGGVGGLDHPPDDELAALGTARGKEDVEAVLAVLALLELIEDAVGKGTEALGAAGKKNPHQQLYLVVQRAATLADFSFFFFHYLHEAPRMKQVPVGVDDLGPRLKAVVAARAGHGVHLDLAVVVVVVGSGRERGAMKIREMVVRACVRAQPGMKTTTAQK